MAARRASMMLCLALAGPTVAAAAELTLATRALLFGVDTRRAADSLFNPDNRVATLPRGELEMHLRPDIKLSGAGWQALARPRLVAQASRTGLGGQEETASDASFALNEAWLRADLGPDWVALAGRKVLLWGPSMFVSPSNPFFVDNGRANPYREIGGRDFAQFYHFSGDALSLQGIVNFGRGEDETGAAFTGDAAFRPIAAVKLDWTGERHNFGLILSGQEGQRPRLGGHGQFTASEGLLLYGEAALRKGSETRYPVRFAAAPGGDFTARDKDSNQLHATALAGASYTLAAGPTLHFEYLHNGEGYGDGDAAEYYDLARDLGQAGALAPLGKGIAPGRLLLRRHYLFAQYLNTEIGRNVELTLRYTHNLDDGSGQFVPILAWNADDRLQLFALGVFNSGDARSEFGQVFKRQLMLGGVWFM